MKTNNSALITLGTLVAFLSLIACVAGLWPSGSVPERPVTVSVTGEQVELEGVGLYRNDSVSFASQAKAQDLVTLFVGIPLLLVSLAFACRGSLRARLVLAGTFAYFTYTYATYSFGSHYNGLFLAYTALLPLSLSGFILSLRALDPMALAASFHGKRVRIAAVAFDFFAGVMILAMWLARILPGFFSLEDKTLIEHYTTLPIQVMDLGFVVPLALAAGWLLAKKSPMGYLLTGLFLMKGMSLGLAIASMIVWSLVAGLPANMVEIAIFTLIIVSGLTLAALFVRAIGAEPSRLDEGPNEAT